MAIFNSYVKLPEGTKLPTQAAQAPFFSSSRSGGNGFQGSAICMADPCHEGLPTAT